MLDSKAELLDFDIVDTVVPVVAELEYTGEGFPGTVFVPETEPDPEDVVMPEVSLGFIMMAPCESFELCATFRGSCTSTGVLVTGC